MSGLFLHNLSSLPEKAQLLSKIQADYTSKGVQVVAAAFDQNARTQVADFERNFVRGYSVGYSDRQSVLEFTQQPMMALYVPILVFIDRKGVIHSQYLGDSPFLLEAEKNIRAELDKLLAKSMSPISRKPRPS